jgi:para-nitrobenzyl esterase
MRLRTRGVALLCFVLPIDAITAAMADGIDVQIAQGSLIGQRADGVNSFKNIPYAAPPVGELRWRSPREPATWEGRRDARSFGAPCPAIDGSKMQQGKRVSGAYDIFIDVPLAAGSQEDCLNLNVWAPSDAKSAAVMVWIQPLGPSSFPLFDGSAFARDGIVFVSMDYRQLTLGNFAHPALTKEVSADEPLARFQTMDQIAALRWVRKNIAAFGGDPGNVTVFGESAGAAAVLQLLTIPEAKTLFDKAIVQSGAGWWSPFTLAQMERVGSWVAARAGLPGKDATAAQLRALPASSLAQLGVYSVDGRLQPESATTLIAAGRFADIPIMIGWTDFDGSSLRSRSPEAHALSVPESVKRAYVNENKTGADLGYQMYTDSHVGAPARWIATKAQSGARAYLYLFSYVRSANRGKVRGAAHGDDIPFVFGTWDKAYPQLELSEDDRRATRMVRSCWITFAKHGKPSCETAPEWPRYTRADDTLMELGIQPQLRKNFRREQLDAQEKAKPEIIAAASRSVEELLERIDKREMP